MVTSAEVEARALLLESDYTADILNNNFTDLTGRGGKGTMTGAFGYGEGQVRVVDDLDVLGAVSLNYDFNTGTLNGTASNFFAVDTEAALDGTVNITMVYDGTGTFDFDGEALGSVDGSTLDLTARANFYREDAKFIGGLVNGTSDDGQTNTSVSGLFVAD